MMRPEDLCHITRVAVDRIAGLQPDLRENLYDLKAKLDRRIKMQDAR